MAREYDPETVVAVMLLPRWTNLRLWYLASWTSGLLPGHPWLFLLGCFRLMCRRLPV